MLCFSPFSLTARVCLQKLRATKASTFDRICVAHTTLLFTPPPLGRGCVHLALMPPGPADPTAQQQNHPLDSKLQLAAWTVSGNLLVTEASLSSQLRSSVLRGQLELRSNIKGYGKKGLAGIINNRLIYSSHL